MQIRIRHDDRLQIDARAVLARQPGSGTSPVPVSAALSGLTPNTDLPLQDLGDERRRRPIKGSDETFKTLPAPTVVTEQASPVTQTTATLNATVNPNGVEVTECKFEYGTTTAYGSTAPCALPSPGRASAPVAVSAAVTGLHREHHLPLQDRRDQRRWRARHRLRRNVQNAAQRTGGRDRRRRRESRRRRRP